MIAAFENEFWSGMMICCRFDKADIKNEVIR